MNVEHSPSAMSRTTNRQRGEPTASIETKPLVFEGSSFRCARVALPMCSATHFRGSSELTASASDAQAEVDVFVAVAERRIEAAHPIKPMAVNETRMRLSRSGTGATC